MSEVNLFYAVEFAKNQDSDVMVMSQSKNYLQRISHKPIRTFVDVNTYHKCFTEKNEALRKLAEIESEKSAQALNKEDESLCQTLPS